MSDAELGGNNTKTEQPAEPGQTTYGTLGAEVPFDPETAQRLKEGTTIEDESPKQAEAQPEPPVEDETRLDVTRSEQPEKTDEPEQMIDQPEQSDDKPGQTDDKAEQSDDKPEQETAQPEKPAEKPEQNQEREKGRVEKRLEAMQKELKDIEQRLEDANNNKESLEEEIDACEWALEANTKEHEQLLDKANKLELNLKQTHRNIISRLASALKAEKSRLSGNEDEEIRMAEEALDNLKTRKKTKKEYQETQAALRANETERSVELEGAYESAIDKRNAENRKITSLERAKADLSKRIELMKEEAANEAWKEGWKDAQEGIKAEMGHNNVASFRRELDSQKEQLDNELNSYLDKLDTKYRNPDEVDRLMRTAEQLQQDAEKADEVEKILKGKHDNAIATIDAKREKVDRYFPTWYERIKNIKENNLVKGALYTLKRKMLMRLRGIA